MNLINNKEIIARRVAKELQENMVVNLGIGLPTLVSNYVDPNKHIMLHSENGFVGLDSSLKQGTETERNKMIIDAGGMPSSIILGGQFFDSSISFGLIRGGHIDITVLGALQVDKDGNLANYMIPGKMIPGMGGAMDLVSGAKKVIIAMEHLDRNQNRKIVKKCKLPLTGMNVVDMIVTEMGVMRLKNGKVILEEINPKFTLEEVINSTEAELIIDVDLKKMC